MSYNLAIVHDYLTKIGGAEMTLKALGEIWPQAPIYSLLYDKNKLTENFIPNPIRVSFLKKLPRFLQERKKLILPLLTVAPETFDLRDFDVIITSSGAFSKSVITKPSTKNICYCHSPMRFCWDYSHEYLNELSLGKLRGLMARLVLNYVRMWDVVSAERVDYFIANSLTTKEKIKKYYKREAQVIYPPVETEEIASKGKFSTKDQGGDYYLIVSRLSRYKKIDIAVEAFNKLGWKLIIIGEGPEEKRLKKLAGTKIKILGYQRREQVIKHYNNCKGYILPGEEDFGISAVEAMAAGKPVLALRKGGALETVEEGITGEFFDSPVVEVLAQGAYRLDKASKNYDPEAIKNQAAKFSKERFQKEILAFVEEKLGKK